MKFHFVTLFGLLLLSCGKIPAQQLDSISSFKLSYWRAFNGDIAMTILRPPSGEPALNTDVTTNENGEKTTKHFVKTISQSDLLPLLQLINDKTYREAFLKNTSEVSTDGSSLSLTVCENGLTLGFNCQMPFDKNAAAQDKALAQVAKYLFQLADLHIPDRELY